MSNAPLDDEFDRQTFYRGQDPEAEAQDDYELLPPDEDVIAGEKKRAEEAVHHASKAVDLDELYREDNSVTIQEVEQYLQDFKFQFGTKHLLMAMTAFALLFVLGRYVFESGALIVVLTFTALASIYGWFTWQEHKRRQEWERKRDKLYRRHQERHDEDIETSVDSPDESWRGITRQDSSLAAWDAAVARPPIRLSFSTFDLLTVATLLCIAMVAVALWGLPGATLACGILLVGGVMWNMLLPHPPQGLASGLWVLVLFYVGLNVLTLLIG